MINNKYSNLPIVSAPEWMNDLRKPKSVRYAELIENSFQLVINGKLVAKGRCEFAILFFTFIDALESSSFVAMDKTNGNLYLISYREDNIDSFSYVIEKSELLHEQYFNEIIDNHKDKIPGVKTIYGDFYNRNWSDFLEPSNIQVNKYFYLAISFRKNGKKNLLHFTSNRLLPIGYSCTIQEYDNWKTKHCNMLDDLIYLNKLMGDKFYSAKKSLGCSPRKVIAFNHLRKEIFKEADISINSNEGNVEIILIKHGLLQYKKNTSNASIESAVEKILDLLECDNK